MKLSWGLLWRGFWFALATLFIIAFFVVTYPNGFVVIGWTLFYLPWYIGIAVFLTAIVVLSLPYIGRASRWEAEHVKNRWLYRVFFHVSVFSEVRTQRIAAFIMRSVVTLEYVVLNQCAKIHHKSQLSRLQMFLEHFTKLLSRVLRQNGALKVQEVIVWRR